MECVWVSLGIWLICQMCILQQTQHKNMKIVDFANLGPTFICSTIPRPKRISDWGPEEANARFVYPQVGDGDL